LKELNLVQKERGWDIGCCPIGNGDSERVHPRGINGDAGGLVTGFQNEGIALAGRRMEKRAKCIGDNRRIPGKPALIGRNPQIAKSALLESIFFQKFARKSRAWSLFR
jgi:hypothetical protein